jgi:membrane-associated protease RseP (regulator of RpoE activity)
MSQQHIESEGATPVVIDDGDPRFQTATERLSHWGDDGTPPAGGQARSLRLAMLVGLVALLGILGGWAPLFIVLAILVMVFLHELGHYLTAKASGMKVTEFFIGFGPRIWSYRRGETEYGLKVVPAGAYVKIIGMHSLDDVPPEDEPRTYRQQSYPRRMAVALAGSTMHFLLAIVLLFTVLAVFGAEGGTLLGTRNDARWEVASISKLASGPSPAEQAGIELGDRIVAINGVEVGDFEALRLQIRQHPGEEVTLVVLRDGERIETTTTLASQNPTSNEQVGFLGIGPGFATEHVGVLAAVPRAFGEFGAGVKQTFGFFGAFFSPHGISQYADQVLGRDEPNTSEPGSTEPPSGPNRPTGVIGIVRIADDAAAAGFATLLLLLASVNIFIGIFNLIPLLPFDGGHAAIATYERIRSRPGRRYFVDITKLMPITYLVVLFLGMLFLTTTYLDVFRFSE